MELNSVPLTKTKAGLRRKFRDLRGGFDERHRAEASENLTENMRRWLKDFVTAQTQVAIYSPMGDEARFDLGEPSEFFFPRILDNKLEFFRPKSARDFDTHELGIREPKVEGAEVLDRRLPAVVFCPAVAVDAEGRRLGQGKGHYDRFFNAVPSATRIGVVYQVQVSADPLPADSWDQRLDWIVTDKMILRTSKRSS